MRSPSGDPPPCLKSAVPCRPQYDRGSLQRSQLVSKTQRLVRRVYSGSARTPCRNTGPEGHAGNPRTIRQYLTNRPLTDSNKNAAIPCGSGVTFCSRVYASLRDGARRRWTSSHRVKGLNGFARNGPGTSIPCLEYPETKRMSGCDWLPRSSAS